MSGHEIIDNTKKIKITNTLIKEFKLIYGKCCYYLGTSNDAKLIKQNLISIIELLLQYKSTLPKVYINTKSMNIDTLMSVLEYCDSTKKGKSIL